MLRLDDPNQKVAYSAETLHLLIFLKDNPGANKQRIIKHFAPRSTPENTNLNYYDRLIENAQSFNLISHNSGKYAVTQVGVIFIDHCKKVDAINLLRDQEIAKEENKLLRLFASIEEDAKVA